jgi:hypothetical protein
MKARGKKLKRRRGPSMTFGELVQKLWQPEPEVLEPKVTAANQRKSAAKRKSKSAYDDLAKFTSPI